MRMLYLKARQSKLHFPPDSANLLDKAEVWGYAICRISEEIKEPFDSYVNGFFYVNQKEAATVFWIFMLCVNLLIPACMIGFGTLFTKGAPADINAFFGYRSAMSMKNKDTWDFAHRHNGHLWRKMGFCMMIGSAVAMLPVLGQGVGFVGVYGGVICGLQLIIMIASVFVTERALKQTFDRNGKRR